jgi:hypothetical protein
MDRNGDGVLSKEDRRHWRENRRERSREGDDDEGSRQSE